MLPFHLLRVVCVPCECRELSRVLQECVSPGVCWSLVLLGHLPQAVRSLRGFEGLIHEMSDSLEGDGSRSPLCRGKDQKKGKEKNRLVFALLVSLRILRKNMSLQLILFVVVIILAELI